MAYSDLPKLVQLDPWLMPHAVAIRERLERLRAFIDELAPLGGLLGQISRGHRYFGINPAESSGEILYREWAPGAHGLSLIGDFNGWDRSAHPLERDDFGVWSVALPPGAIFEGSRVKVHVRSAAGGQDRIPAYIRRAVQDPATHDFSGVYWPAPATLPLQPHLPPLGRAGLRIYEAHVGMATEEERVGTFSEFAENVLPRIARLGYNAVQLMAVQEHPYYGSFGYHVSSFFGVSSRFGTPDDLRALIARAHALGLRVLMDLVHSHAVKNCNEGLGGFDGTDYQYFHAGGRGYHPAWDSLCFDYQRFEVLRFLLSNVRYWLEEYGFDGFRFDGVTSMLYLDHGLGRDFGGYGDYFGEGVDEDAVRYLQLANEVARAVRADVLTVAEDMSGMPGMARPTTEGGLGFDYRLAMGLPDFWIRTLKERRDEDWSLGVLWGTLLNRRAHEKHIAYCESHDQSIVGDQTLAFRLMDAAMYTDMAHGRASLTVARGIALHKLLRLVTFAAGGEGWLCFMGNEFGHPEWVDFPREGNGWSNRYARRQWSLADDPSLRYGGLERFDAAMLALDKDWGLLESGGAGLLLIDEARKLLVFERAGLLFAINWHPEASYPQLRLPAPVACDWRAVLCSDDAVFSGPGRVAPGGTSIWEPVGVGEQAQSLLLYLPSRCALVLAPA